MRLRWYTIALPLLCFTVSALRGQVALVGTVSDSIAHRPLAAALVQVARDSSTDAFSVESDSLGRFRFDSLRAGTYLIGFFHPVLDSIGVELAPRRVTLGPDNPTRIDLSTPSAATIAASLCPTATKRDSLGLLVGFVRDADTGLPRVGEVTVQWMELSIGQGSIRRNRQQFPAKTTRVGWYAICGIPSDIDVIVSARADSLESGVVEVRVPAGGLLVRDFLVSRADSTIAVYADSARTPVATLRRGRARVTGVVLNDKGQPVKNAEVSVPGTGLAERTDDRGEFTLSELPSGTQTLDTRAIGFEPKRVIVDLTPARLTSVQVKLDRRVQTLDAVTIYGTGNRGLAAFQRRLRSGWGHFLTPADIAKRNAFSASDLFRTMPGVRVTPTRGFGNAILLRGGCLPTVYLNGARMPDDAATQIDDLATPNEITAVEVYNTVGRPAEFWGNNCGTVVLWVGMLPR